MLMLPFALSLALAVGLGTALIIAVLHFALWRAQLGQRYGRPVTYIIGVGVLTAGYGVWAALVPGPVPPGVAWVAWGCIVVLAGLADVGCYAWHWVEERRGRAAIRRLAQSVHLPVGEEGSRDAD
jgi:hypothetical protein